MQLYSSLIEKWGNTIMVLLLIERNKEPSLQKRLPQKKKKNWDHKSEDEKDIALEFLNFNKVFEIACDVSCALSHHSLSTSMVSISSDIIVFYQVKRRYADEDSLETFVKWPGMNKMKAIRSSTLWRLPL